MEAVCAAYPVSRTGREARNNHPFVQGRVPKNEGLTLRVKKV
jgi:hypothetical protein